MLDQMTPVPDGDPAEPRRLCGCGSLLVNPHALLCPDCASTLADRLDAERRDRNCRAAARRLLRRRAPTVFQSGYTVESAGTAMATVVRNLRSSR